MKNLKAFTLALGATETDVLSSQTCHPELVSGSNSNQMLKQVQHDRLFKRAGFTLAEVLITLGIIGVVAAMTIPTLVSNYQKRAWTAQLQKSYAVLNQGFRRMLADDGVSALSQTETFQSIGGIGGIRWCISRNSPTGTECNNFLSNLRKYFQISDIKKFEASDNYKTYELDNRIWYDPFTYAAIILSDGAMIFDYGFYSDDNSDWHPDDAQLKRRVGVFTIDVNGTSKPNKMGRDIFLFVLGDDGIVYPYGSIAAASYDVGSDYNSIEEGYWKTSNRYYPCDIKVNGYGCAARVLEEGKMNY